jgi:hypothetical protein
MDDKTKSMLTRWQTLESDEGLKKVRFYIYMLGLVGLLFCMFTVVGVATGINPIATAISAAIMGWIVAETNALRNRSSQWPIFQRYIDWKRVHEDLCNKK